MENKLQQLTQKLYDEGLEDQVRDQLHDYRQEHGSRRESRDARSRIREADAAYRRQELERRRFVEEPVEGPAAGGGTEGVRSDVRSRCEGAAGRRRRSGLFEGGQDGIQGGCQRRRLLHFVLGPGFRRSVEGVPARQSL